MTRQLTFYRNQGQYALLLSILDLQYVSSIHYSHSRPLRTVEGQTAFDFSCNRRVSWSFSVLSIQSQLN